MYQVKIIGLSEILFSVSIVLIVKHLEFLLLILQSFDWLAAFHLELLQAILFIFVDLL
jgi:hypothetical protein